MLDRASLTRALHDLDFVPVIDLFASRINKQLEQYVSYRPDPHAAGVDAFTLTWTKLTFYAFPPFSLIANVLSKIKNEKARECAFSQSGQATLVCESNGNVGKASNSSKSIE